MVYGHGTGDSIFVVAVDQGSPIAVVVTDLNLEVLRETSWPTYAWMEADPPDVEDAAHTGSEPEAALRKHGRENWRCGLQAGLD